MRMLDIAAFEADVDAAIDAAEAGASILLTRNGVGIAWLLPCPEPEERKATCPAP